MKSLSAITLLAAILGVTSCSKSESKEKVIPTDLTVVVCDASYGVIDTVVVPDDQQSRSVKFTLPKGMSEIRVFPLGSRLHQDFPTSAYITGRPNDETWMGLGYVEVHIDAGVLVTIDGNGFGNLNFTEALNIKIVKDIDTGTPAAITTIKLKGEPDGSGQ